jgi:hypothetical protein
MHLIAYAVLIAWQWEAEPVFSRKLDGDGSVLGLIGSLKPKKPKVNRYVYVPLS